MTLVTTNPEKASLNQGFLDLFKAMRESEKLIEAAWQFPAGFLSDLNSSEDSPSNSFGGTLFSLGSKLCNESKEVIFTDLKNRNETLRNWLEMLKVSSVSNQHLFTESPFPNKEFNDFDAKLIVQAYLNESLLFDSLLSKLNAIDAKFSWHKVVCLFQLEKAIEMRHLSFYKTSKMHLYYSWVEALSACDLKVEIPSTTLLY